MKVATKWIKRFIGGEIKLLSSGENKAYNKKKIKFTKVNKSKQTLKVNKGKKLTFKDYNDIVPSEAELKIIKVLNELREKYHRECEFSILINPKTGRKLRFDFYLPKRRLCIEYDGKQHFEVDSTKDIHIESKRLESQKYRDKLKTDFCKTQNIKLIRFKAKHFYNLEIILKRILK